MSDDTPTQRFPSPGEGEPTRRFPAAGDDVPTQRLPRADAAGGVGAYGTPGPVDFGTPIPPAGGPGSTGSPDDEKKSRGLLIALIVAGVLLLIAVIVLVVVLTDGGDDPAVAGSPTPSATPSIAETPSESPTPSTTPSATSEPAPPAASAPAVSYFSTGATTVSCPTATSTVELDIGWSTSGGNQVFFGVDTDDAAANPSYSGLPATGTSGDFPDSPFVYTCSSPSHVYTITVVDSGTQESASESITVAVG